MSYPFAGIKGWENFPTECVTTGVGQATRGHPSSFWTIFRWENWAYEFSSFTWGKLVEVWWYTGVPQVCGMVFVAKGRPDPWAWDTWASFWSCQSYQPNLLHSLQWGPMAYIWWSAWCWDWGQEMARNLRKVSFHLRRTETSTLSSLRKVSHAGSPMAKATCWFMQEMDLEHSMWIGSSWWRCSLLKL